MPFLIYLFLQNNRKTKRQWNIQHRLTLLIIIIIIRIEFVFRIFGLSNETARLNKDVNQENWFISSTSGTCSRGSSGFRPDTGTRQQRFGCSVGRRWPGTCPDYAPLSSTSRSRRHSAVRTRSVIANNWFNFRVNSIQIHINR